LSYTCFTRKIRLSYWSFTRDRNILSDLAVLTSGTELQEGRIDYLPSLLTGFYEITWHMPSPDYGTATKLVTFATENSTKTMVVPTLVVAHQPPPPLEQLYRAHEYAMRYTLPTSPTNEETKEITDWIDEVLQAFPDDKAFLSLYLRVHKTGLDAQRTIRIARELASADPTNGWAYLELGRAQLAGKDLQSAKTSLQNARSLGASPIDVIEALADVYVA